VTLNFLGRVDEADTALETLIALEPGHARAHHLLASLRKQSPATNHIDRLTRTHAQARDDRSKLLLGYALSKELEDVGRAQEALAQLCAVNKAYRQTLPYSFAQDAAAFDAMEAHWPQLAAAPPAMPRRIADLRHRHAAYRHHADRPYPLLAPRC
jgi:hypothetical protein